MTFGTASFADLRSGLFALVIASACSSSPAVSPRSTTTALRGRVTDATGAAIAGVTVRTGTVSATTRADGRYELLASAGERVVSFSKDTHVGVTARLEVIAGAPTQRDVTLLTLAAPVMIDSAAGGMAASTRGASVRAPANAFVTASGAAVTGMVEVRLTPIDPANAMERLAVSGDFTAISDGMTRLLESFGMLDITVRKGTDVLQVASGKQLEIAIPVAAGATAPEAQLPIWSFDEATARWKPEGMATFNSTTRTYTAMISHMSQWNIDKIAEAACVCGLVKERGAGPLPGARVRGDGVSYFGTSEATTGPDGTFCINVRRDSEVDILAYHASGGGMQRRVRSNSMMSPVPPVRGAAYCFDGGTWEVERDVFQSSDGSTQTCASINAALVNQAACLAEYAQVWTCFDSSGSCTSEVSATGMLTLTYASGARAVGSAGLAEGLRFYSSRNQLCATMTSGGTDAVVFTTATGAAYRIMSDDMSNTTVTCPSGQSVQITGAMAQQISACQSGESPSGGGSSMCRMVVPDGGAMVGSPCPSGNECSSGLTCCRIAAGASGQVCLTPATCELAMMR